MPETTPKEKKNKKSRENVSKILYILLSIVLACALWLYVRSTDNADQTVSIRNIPVTFVGEDVLNANNLMLASDRNQTVNLEVQGKWNVISRLRRDNVVVEVDVSQISGAGDHNLAYSITWPSDISASSVSVLERTPFYVTASVSRRVTRPLEIRGVFEGSVAENYVAEGFTFQPDVIQLSGEESEVAKVACAQVTIKRDTPLEESIRGAMEYQLVDRDGNEIKNDLLTCDPATVNVTYSVTMMKDVGLSVNFIPSGSISGADSPYLKYEIEPSQIQLSGSREDLALYSSINLGSIDLAKAYDLECSSVGNTYVGTFTFPIPLGEEVENLSGVQEATVTVTIKGLAIEPRVATNIEVINVPAGYRATVETQSVDVNVRGTPETLGLVQDEYLQVVADLQNEPRPLGRNKISTVKVNVLGVNGAGVVGEYKVTISLAEDAG